MGTVVHRKGAKIHFNTDIYICSTLTGDIKAAVHRHETYFQLYTGRGHKYSCTLTGDINIGLLSLYPYQIYLNNIIKIC